MVLGVRRGKISFRRRVAAHNNAVKEREDRVAREAKKQRTLPVMETSIEQQDKVSQASSSLVNFITLPLCNCSL